MDGRARKPWAPVAISSVAQGEDASPAVMLEVAKDFPEAIGDPGATPRCYQRSVDAIDVRAKSTRIWKGWGPAAGWLPFFVKRFLGRYRPGDALVSNRPSFQSDGTGK